MSAIVCGDARRLPLAESTVDAIVCDPPYELGFMGKTWDRAGVAFAPATWVEALRVAKPGAHLLAFGGTRTYHRLAVAIEDAGWVIRDSIGVLGWLYGSGFPKSLDVGKAIDREAGAERLVVGQRDRYRDGAVRANRGPAPSIFRVPGSTSTITTNGVADVTAPATDDAARWQGWGTALKPAWEPIIVARKPFAGTVAQNVLRHGTGALNVDGCRVETSESTRRSNMAEMGYHGGNLAPSYQTGSTVGRWPTNLVLVHHPDCGDDCIAGCPMSEVDGQSGSSVSRRAAGRNGTDSAVATFGLARTLDMERGHDDSGGASRFFPTFRYQAKARRSQRPELDCPDGTVLRHPTVKPLDLMRWLVRLVTPPGGMVLDQFAGSGATVQAAQLEGMRAIGVELDPGYCRLTRHRLGQRATHALHDTLPDAH